MTSVNWPMVKKEKIWAVDTRHKKTKVRKGDRIIFYVKGSMYFQGIFEVISEWNLSTLAWPDGRKIIGEIKLKQIQIGYASIKQLYKKLEFMKNYEIGITLMGSYHGPSNFAKPISEQDYDLIIVEMQQIQEKSLVDLNSIDDNKTTFESVDSWEFIDQRMYGLSTPESSTICNIMDSVKSGKYVIPGFQREFIWKRKQIEELWESIFQGFFIGSILVWTSLQDFDVTSITGTPKPNKPYEMILDGQQRITSLFYAMYGLKSPFSDKREFNFYINLINLLDPESDPSDIIFSENKEKSKKFGYTNQKIQFKEKIFPLTALRGDTCFTWIYDFKDYLEEIENMSKKESKIYCDKISKIFQYVLFNYKIPIIHLSESISIESVAEIFEKINSKGTRLNIFDLLNAKFITYNIELRNLWNKTKSEYNNIKQLEEKNEGSEKLILQGISLHKQNSVRRRKLLNLDQAYIDPKFQKNEFEEDWQNICKFTSKAIDQIQSHRDSGFGAVQISLIPYTTTIPILASLLYEIEDKQNKAKCMDQIRKWYWCVVTSDKYSGSTDSNIEKDYREMLEWFDDESEKPDVVSEQERKFEHINSNAEIDFSDKSVLCLLAIKGAKDFNSDDNPEYNEIEIHHIFPKSLKDVYGNKFNIDSILNKTLLSKKTNRELFGNTKPNVYLKKILDDGEDEKILRHRLKTHLISDEAFDCLMKDDFNGFMNERRTTINNAFKQLIMQLKLDVSNPILDLLNKKESQTLEYKSSLRWDLKQNKPNTDLGIVIVKSLCAFMNSKGGDLFIGVDDDGKPLGLKKDYNTFSSKNSDDFLQHLTNLINKHLGKPTSAYIDIDFIYIDEIKDEICLCKIKPAKSPIFCKINNDKQFFRRSNNTSSSLDSEDAYKYISEHWE